MTLEDLHPEQFDEIRIVLITVNAETVKRIEHNSSEYRLREQVIAEEEGTV